MVCWPYVSYIVRLFNLVAYLGQPRYLDYVAYLVTQIKFLTSLSSDTCQQFIGWKFMKLPIIWIIILHYLYKYE